jgi:hypothetical protein
MDPKERGERSEAQALARLTERGFDVLTPWGDNQRYDFVLDVEGEFATVQVKTARHVGEGVIKFKCSSNNWNTGETKNYRGQVDVFVVYSPDLQECFMVPVEDAGTKAMRLRYKMPKNNQRKGISWAVDYIL